MESACCPWLVSSCISIQSCCCWWSPFITTISYTPLLSFTQLSLSLTLSSSHLVVTTTFYISLPDFDFCLFTSFGFSLRGLTFFRFRLPFSTSLCRPLVLTHIPHLLFLTKSLLFASFVPQIILFLLCSLSSLCRVCLPRFVHVWDADQDVRSGHPALLPFLIQLLRLCGECTNSHTKKCTDYKIHHCI